MKKVKVIICLIFLNIVIYFICSYRGVLFFKKGFGTIDIVLLEIVGNSFIVGIVTYFSTKFVSEYLQEKEFNRNNVFLDICINNSVIFEMDKEDTEIIEKIFQKYLEWDSIIKSGNKDYKKEIAFINILFIFGLSKYKFNFYEFWKESYEERVENKENICTISDEDFIVFSKLVNILSNLRFYNLRNLSKNNIARGIILGNGRVISKFSLFPNQNKILGYFYKEDIDIEILVFYRDYKGKEKYDNIMGFKYQVIENNIPANIDLESLIK